jgi:glutathione S-transferase
LATHIVAREAGLPIEMVKVDLATHKTADGRDFYAINPRGYVPVVELDDGTRLTEASVLVQFLADQRPQSNLLPAGGIDRVRVQMWLNFIATELHKGFGPLWAGNTPEATKKAAIERLATRFAELDRHLASRDYLMGKQFGVADAYAFTIVNWANFHKIDLKPYANLSAFMARVVQRPKVREAMAGEGLIKAAA